MSAVLPTPESPSKTILKFFFEDIVLLELIGYFLFSLYNYRLWIIIIDWGHIITQKFSEIIRKYNIFNKASALPLNGILFKLKNQN